MILERRLNIFDLKRVAEEAEVEVGDICRPRKVEGCFSGEVLDFPETTEIERKVELRTVGAIGWRAGIAQG